MEESQFDVEDALPRLTNAGLLILPHNIPNLVESDVEDALPRLANAGLAIVPHIPNLVDGDAHEHEDEVPVDHPNPPPATSGLSDEHQRRQPLDAAAELLSALRTFQEMEGMLFRLGESDNFSYQYEDAIEAGPEDYNMDSDRDEYENSEDDSNMEQDSENESIELESLAAGPPESQMQILITSSDVSHIVAPSPLPSSQLLASTSDLTICHSNLEPILPGVDGASVSEYSTAKEAPADGSNILEGELVNIHPSAV